MDLFDRIYDDLMRHEGGFSDDPRDPGNWTGGSPGKGILKGTNKGISAKAYPDLDIRNLTDEEIKRIYREDYYEASGASKIAEFSLGTAYCVFDPAVNAGIGRSIRLLQKSVGAKPDGVLGPKTLAAVRQVKSSDLLKEYTTRRLMFYIRLTTFKVYGLGWVRRSVDVHTKAMELER